jgi:hypothetical protein
MINEMPVVTRRFIENVKEGTVDGWYERSGTLFDRKNRVAYQPQPNTVALRPIPLNRRKAKKA